MAYEIVPYFWKRFTSLMVVQDVHQKVTQAAGVSQEVEKLANNFKAILDVFPDAQAREMKEAVVSDWLNKVRDISYDMDDAFDEYNTSFLRLQVQLEGGGNPLANKEVRFFLPLRFFSEIVALCRHSALMIEKINKNLNDLVQETNRLNLNRVKSSEKQKQITPLSDDRYGICGRDDEKKRLLSGLLSESSHEKNGIHIISIVGTGGIGKTALAQFAYNNDDVKKNFNERIWIHVSNHSDEFRIAKAIIEALGGSTSDLVELKYLLEHISGMIKRKKLKFFLVLDDVREEDCNKCKLFYPCLESGFNGSKILITTREETVANMMESMDIIVVKELSGEGCWSLFEELAFCDCSDEERKNLEEIGKTITEKCKGLPLLVKTFGSLLRFKRTRKEWQYILDNGILKLEEPEKGLLPAFLLSYNDLPSLIRLCFSYCAIFMKDHSMEKDKLIRLWMAQGYLGLEQNVEMEIIGERYFDHLAKLSFFEIFFEKDDDDEVITICKIHNTMLDFAQFLVKSSHENAFHSMLMAEQKTSIVETICSEKRLRSLLISDSDSQSDPLNSNDVKMLPGELTCLKKLFGQLTGLRTLMLDGCGIFVEEIPEEIGKLVHLRYIDLSGQKIEQLPETLCELYNLQTLDLTKCENLEKLPQGMGKLINLRHLINRGTRSLSYMPSGIERLICLRTLNEFVVSCGGGQDTKACLECLKDLNHLQGKLEIRGLGNVTNVKGTKVLMNKRNLISLALRFDKCGEGESMSKDDEVLEALQPHQNLEKLEIEKYRGNPFCFNWMMSLTRLRELILKNWENCEQLPPFGKLSSLESLHIECMSGMKRVGNEFLGRKNDDTSPSSSSDILFPKLKTLTFWKMEKWYEWDFEMTGQGEEENFTIMPCIASLSISSCPQLKVLPDSLLKRKTLEKLVIAGCEFLTKQYEKGTGVDWSKICHIPTIEMEFELVQGGS